MTIIMKEEKKKEKMAYCLLPIWGDEQHSMDEQQIRL